jgi:AraC family transcriptional regulator
MSQEHSLTVDFTQKDTLLSVLPCLPIASSHAAGWDKIQLADYRQPPHIIPEHCSLQHIICINVGNPVVLEQVVDGHAETVHSVNGEIGIYPANLWQTFRWDRETEFLQLYLEPRLLKLINEELCGTDRVELIPQLTSLFDPLIHNIGLALKSALEIDGLGSRLYAESMANALAVHLLSRYSTRKRVIRHYKGGLSQQHLKQVKDYINEYLDQDLSLAELAAVVQLSAYHFARLFKQSTRVSPHQFLIRCRVERAKQLLLKGDLTIAQVAQAVGFASQAHLNYHFKRLVGMTPKTFLRK